MKLLVFFSLVFFMKLLSANTAIGTITKLRGTVSILELGEKEAKSAREGQKVFKEASILTSEKSFVSILMLDKSQINLGPSSKIILDQTAFQKVGVISLLRGMLRTVVEKEKGQKDKLYIKTRMAALGIRGTDFLTNYNPENKITNLVTFSGKVAMVKNENENETEKLAESLSSSDVVFVESGKFATVTDNLANATGPVKISAVQYTGLKLNNEMDKDIKISKEEFQVELEKTINQYAELSKFESKTEKLATSEYDAKNKTLRPTSGGVVDLMSGIYVPPSETIENFNKDLNIYEFKSDRGEITVAGSYTPPMGTVLDSKLGFIADPKGSKVASFNDLLKLNQEIAPQMIKPIKARPKPSREDLKGNGEDAYDKYFIKE